MNRYGFYEEFMKGNKIRLKELFNELHTCYDIRADLYKDIRKHRTLLEYVGIDFSLFESLMTVGTGSKIFYKRSNEKLPIELVKNINTLKYLNSKKIPAIKHELKLTRLLCNMPQRLYFIMQYDFNKEIANSLLRGGVYNFGQGLSKLGISYVKRSANAKPCIDWGESNKLKAKLIELGHTVKSKFNPEGIKWLLFRTDDGYCFWKWLKVEAFTPNKKMYKFRPIATNNECTDYKGELNQEQILEKSIGTFDKMMALLKLNPQIINTYDF